MFQLETQTPVLPPRVIAAFELLDLLRERQEPVPFPGGVLVPPLTPREDVARHAALDLLEDYIAGRTTP